MSHQTTALVKIIGKSIKIHIPIIYKLNIVNNWKVSYSPFSEELTIESVDAVNVRLPIIKTFEEKEMEYLMFRGV